jgi:hypothetical protein
MNSWKSVVIAAAFMALLGWWLWHEAVSSDGSALLSREQAVGQNSNLPSAASRNGSLRELLRKMIQGGQPPQLTAEQLRAFVEKQGRSASSLLAAWTLGGDRAWLEEAAQRFPDNPRVALAKISSVRQPDPDAKVWIERLKTNDPGNATGWCYDAFGFFQEGDVEAARAALAEAAQSRRFDGYVKEGRDTMVEAYRSAGYEGIEAELFGRAQPSVPLAGIAMEVQRKALSAPAIEFNAGLVQDMLAMSKLVRGSTETPLFTTQIVASGMEERVLRRLDVHELVPGTSKFAFERLGEIEQERANLAALRQRAIPVLLSADLLESELKQFFRRSSIEGDVQAIQWLVSLRPAQ